MFYFINMTKILFLITIHHILTTNFIVLSSKLSLNSNNHYSDLPIVTDETISQNDNLIDVSKAEEWKSQLLNRPSEVRIKRFDESNFIVMTKKKKNSSASIDIDGKNNCNFEFNVKRDSYCRFTIVLTNAGKPITKGKIDLLLTTPNGHVQSYVMSDSGNESDFTPNDGIYAYTVYGSAFREVGIYMVQAKLNFKLEPSSKTFTQRVETLNAVKVNNPFSPDNSLSESVNPKEATVKPKMVCEDIIPPTWNYRCIVKVSISDGNQPITDATVTMEITDPRGNKTMVPMYNNRLDKGIYKSSVIGRDFSIKGNYEILANINFNRQDKSSKLSTRSVKIGTLNCMKDNPPNQIDNFPPDQIEIISVRLLNKLKHTFELKFVAVGDDGDRLRVKNYEIQVNGATVAPVQLQHSTPRLPGEIESVVFDIADSSNEPNSVLVRAVDHAENRGDWSIQEAVKSKSANQIQSINKSILFIILSIIFNWLFFL